MMKLLLVVLSMLYGANAQSVSGCNSDIIESLGLRRTASLTSLFPRIYTSAAVPFLAAGYDSSTTYIGLPVAGKSYTTVVQCKSSEVLATYSVDFTQATDERLQGIGFPVDNLALDYFPVECTDGIVLVYVCDPSQVRGSGTESFVMFTRSTEPVSTEAFEACKARAQEVYPDVEFTQLEVGIC